MRKIIIFLGIICFSLATSLSVLGVPSSQRKIILISIDTLRPDHLGFNGYKRNTSPNIDRLAEEAVIFNNAYTPIPWTVPAHISLLTGLHPIEFGIFNNRFQRVDKLSLANLFEKKGYETAAFVSSSLVSFEFFRKGFDYFDYEPEMSERDLHRMREKRMQKESLKHPGNRQRPPHFGPRSRSRKGAKTNKGVLEWLDKNHNKDFFLWIHYFDPVFPYEDDCGQNFRSSLEGSSQIREGFLHSLVSSPAGGSAFEKASPEEIKLLKAKYDEGVFCADKNFGEVIEKLKKLDIYNGATIILLSDHGAGFEHYLFHGEILYEEAIRIPLIVKSPLLESQNKSIDTPVSLLDIYPALVKKFSLEKGSAYNTELCSAIKGTAKERELFFITLARQRIPERVKEKTGRAPEPKSKKELLSKAVISNNKKLIVDDLKLELMELYNLDSDPSEQKNLINSSHYKELIEKLKNKITTFFK